MPPILVDQQGDQLIFQNDDGSTFPVAASGLSSDYMSQLSSGMPAPSPKDQMINELSRPTGGYSSVLNPGPLDYGQQTAWQSDLAKRGPANVSPEEYASFKSAAPESSLSFKNQALGENIIPAAAAPTMAQPMLPEAPATEAAPKKEEPSELEKGFSQQAQGIRQEYQATAKAADEAAKQYKAAADEYLNTQTKMQAIQDEGQRIADTQMKKIADTQTAYEKMEIKNPWAEMSTGSKIGAALAIGLGAHAAAILGGENQAYKIINDAVNRDIDIQLKQIDKKGAELSHDKDYLGLIRQATNDKQSQALMLKDLKLASIENQIKSLESSAKSGESKGRMNQLLGQLTQARQGIALDIAQKQANIGKTIAETSAAMNPAKNLPQNAYQAAIFGRRAEQSENVFNELDKKGFDRSSFGTSVSKSLLPDSLETENMKRQDQAERNFVNAVLRRESGAAISNPEFESANLQYFPRAGDSKKVLEQKRQNRAIAIQGLMAEAGPAASLIPAAPGQAGLSDQQKAAYIQWAKDNPNNPKAQAILKSLQ